MMYSPKEISVIVPVLGDFLEEAEQIWTAEDLSSSDTKKLVLTAARSMLASYTLAALKTVDYMEVSPEDVRSLLIGCEADMAERYEIMVMERDGIDLDAAQKAEFDVPDDEEK